MKVWYSSTVGVNVVYWNRVGRHSCGLEEWREDKVNVYPRDSTERRAPYQGTQKEGPFGRGTEKKESQTIL